MGWINAGILAGFAALAVPVAIHLLRSRRFRPAELGTLRFLEQAVRESVRWRRLRDLLLLALRLIILTLLVLLFARPFLRDPDEAAAGETDAVVLLDVSGSMAGGTLGVSNLVLARDNAVRFLEGLPATTHVTTALYAESVLEVEDFDSAELSAAGRTDHAAALLWARDRLTLSQAMHKRVVLFTDMQATGLPEQTFSDWPLDLNLDIVPAMPAGTWNVAITEIRNLSPFLGTAGTIEVSIAWFGDYPAESEGTVTLEIDGQPPLQHPLPPRPGTMEFHWNPTRVGVYRGSARITLPDPYPQDNARHFAFALSKPRKILLVDGDPGKTRYDGDTYFLAAALTVARRAGQQAAFSVDHQRECPADLTPYDAVALCNTGDVQPRQARHLFEFVAAGGGLIYFLGDRVGPAAVNTLSRMDIFPGQLASTKAPVPRQIIQWDVSHPALKLFDTREKGDLSRIVFREAFKLLPDADCKVLARLSNDAPAMVEKELGKGSVIIVTNPCDRDWTNWPTERVFLPLVRELFDYLAARRRAGENVVHRPTALAEERGPGVYGQNPVTLVAAEPVESDFRPVEETVFRERLGVGLKLPEADENVDAAEAPAGRERENEIWPYLACALLLVLFVENATADRGRT